jgi:leucyl aminopeptidase (aminopeptidase T)
MQDVFRHIALGVSLAATSLALPASAQVSKPGAADKEGLAQKIVNDSARVKEGDLVLITGSARDTELLENIATYVRQAGAFPMVSLNTQRMGQLYFKKVPAKYDSQEPKLNLELTKVFNVNINLDPSEALDAFATVPPDRRAALGKAFEPVNTLALKRNVRTVNVGNELYPTTSRAQLYGVSKDQLAQSFWGGINVDYAKLQATAKAGQAALGAGKVVHITNPNGTDIRMKIEGRPVLASDGVISEDDIKKGGAACAVYLPAGEVYVTPVPGTAEGKVVVDHQLFEGKDIPGLALTFTGGKLTAMTAKSGLEPLRALYDAAGAGKDQLGVLDIGINPNVRHTPGSKMLSWVPAGMVTLVVGGDQWAGGDNASTFNLANFLPGSTVTVDDKVIVDKGTLKF